MIKQGSTGDRGFESLNPVTGGVVWSGATSDRDAVTRVVAEAREAQRLWVGVDVSERVAVAKRYAALVAERVDELATLITRETGKLGWDAMAEAKLVSAKVGVSIEAMAHRGEHRVDLPGGHGVALPRALGVCAVLGPFNFPAHLPNGQIVPALLAGNAVVFKPSDKSPAVGAWLIERWLEAGLPAGVLGLVQGGVATAEALVDAAVDGVFFTGSYAAGRAIHQRLAGRPEVLLALEMGGNNPVVVHPKADVEAAAYLVVLSAFISSGQRCTCARRLIVMRGEHGDRVVDAVVELAGRLVVGLPGDEIQAFVGPLIDDASATRVLEAQEKLIVRGGGLLLRSEIQTRCDALVSPGLVDMTDVASIEDEEVFGPLLVVRRVASWEDAMQEADATRYGLAAALLGGTPSDFALFSERVRAGVLNHNGPTTGASGKLPFGGLGLSGNHRPAGWEMAGNVVDMAAEVHRDELMIPATLPPGFGG